MSTWGPLVALACVSLVLRVGWRKWAEAGSEYSTSGQRLGSAARFFYFVGFPYVAIITGVLPPRFLGLKGLEYFISINLSEGWTRTVADLQKAITMLLLEGLVDGRMMIGAGLTALLVLIGLRLGLARLGLGLAAGPNISISDTLYDCLHWAFYRAIFWVITGDLYLGVVWGLAWVMVEGVLVAWAQKDWPVQKLYYLTNTIILILTSTIFFYSPNLWLLGLVHLLLVTITNLHLQRDPVRGIA